MNKNKNYSKPINTFFCVPGFIASMMLLLRRTLVLLNCEWSVLSGKYYSQLTVHHSQKKFNNVQNVQECDATEDAQSVSDGLKKNIKKSLLNNLQHYINLITKFCSRSFYSPFRGLGGLIFLLMFISCNKKKTLFQLLPSSQTGIHFVNKVVEDDKYNVLEYMNIYTGAGVAAGDINNDGLVDLYFSSNQTTGRLYLNKGNFQFEDITEKAGLITDRWCTGVSMVDINSDGFLDIYVNVAGSAKFGNMHNLLYIRIYMYQMIFLPTIFYTSITVMELFVIKLPNA